MALFWVFLIVFLIRLLRGGRHHGRMWHSWHDGNALDILKERYAKGEITREQFEQMKKDIQ